jgi:preprotein translocase subunit SecE
MADKIRLALAALLAFAGAVLSFQWADSALVVRVLVFVAGVAVAVGVAWTTAQGQLFRTFAHESVVETRKVVWPSRKETVQTTAIVMLFVFVMAVFLWVVDASLAWVVRLLMVRGE